MFWMILCGAGFFIAWVFVVFLTGSKANDGTARSVNGQVTTADDSRLAADQRFRSRGTLMSPAEASLFGNLTLILGDGYAVFSKVRMADVLEPVQNGREGKSAFNEISQKHLDFVICRNGTWEIVCAVELDDASHRRNARVARDFFVDVIFGGAGIPLIRVPVQRGYSVQELRE